MSLLARGHGVDRAYGLVSCTELYCTDLYAARVGWGARGAHGPWGTYSCTADMAVLYGGTLEG